MKANLLVANADSNVQIDAQDSNAVYTSLREMSDLGVDHVKVSGDVYVRLGLDTGVDTSSELDGLLAKLAKPSEPLFNTATHADVNVKLVVTQDEFGLITSDPNALKQLLALGIDELRNANSGDPALDGWALSEDGSNVKVTALGHDPNLEHIIKDIFHMM